MSKLYKLTYDGFNWLAQNISENKDLYDDPNADFGKILSENISEYCEETQVEISKDIDMELPTNPQKTHLADKNVLGFYNSLKGMTERLATDPKIWSYVNHFHLHKYGISRWPRGNKDADTHVQNHWFTDDSGKIWNGNISGRTWWLAHIATQAAEASNGAFTAQEAVDTFSEVPEYFHRSMEYEVLRNRTLMAECIRVLRNEAAGISRDGFREFAKELNREAGAKLLDSLKQTKIREITTRSADRLMKMPQFVPDRKNLKGVKKTKVLSMGAGTQSTVMALMAEEGWDGLEKPDFAIFADTQWEPPEVYEHLDWLEKQLSYDVIRVTAGNIRENILDGVTPEGHNFLDLPVFLTNADGTKSIARRQCTNHYKITPIHKKLREMLDLKPGKRAPKNVQVEMWMGISQDEAHRMRDSRDEWITNRYPLIEMELTRAQLYKWFEDRYPGRKLPRSACIGCPYHNNMEWKSIKENDPKSFQDAVFIDRAIREVPRIRGSLKGEGYLHKSRQSLDTVDFSKEQDYDDFMESECEGLCGV